MLHRPQKCHHAFGKQIWTNEFQIKCFRKKNFRRFFTEFRTLLETFQTILWKAFNSRFLWFRYSLAIYDKNVVILPDFCFILSFHFLRDPCQKFRFNNYCWEWREWLLKSTLLENYDLMFSKQLSQDIPFLCEYFISKTLRFQQVDMLSCGFLLLQKMLDIKYFGPQKISDI